MKQEQPLVSICCITYNHENYIREAIESFLMQKTTFPIEIIIHDDASTDKTAKIVKEYATKYPMIIIPIFQTKNQYSLGIKPWPNFVFPLARGKYIALCEGDDYWTDPFKLQKQVDFLVENDEYGLVHTKYEILQGDIKFTHELWKYDKLMSDFENYLFTGDIRTLTVLFRASFLDEIISFLNHPGMFKAPMSDRSIFLLIAIKSKIYYINEVTGVYRILKSSASNYKSITKHVKFIRNTAQLNFFLLDYLKIVNTNYINYLHKRLSFIDLIIYFLEFKFNKLFFNSFKYLFMYGWSLSEFKEFLILSRLYKPKSRDF